MSLEIADVERMSLSAGHLPSYDEVNEVLGAFNDQQTILTQPRRRYMEVFCLYPLGSDITEFDEIAEAAAFGDPVAAALEWAFLREEADTVSSYTDASWISDLPRDREKAVEDWEKHRDFMRSFEAREHGPTETIEETLELLDSSIAVIAGAITVAALDSSRDQA